MQRYLRQGTLDFSVGYRLQTRWGAAEAAVFALECAGAALIALSILYGDPLPGIATGVAFVAAAIVMLLMHLGHPARAWRAMLSVRTSWISRGTLALGALLALGLAQLVLLASPPHASGPAPSVLLAGPLLILAAFVSCYPGLVLSSSPAIPFWSSGLLPVVSAVSGLASGLVIFLALLAAGGRDAVSMTSVSDLAGGALGALAIVVAIYVASMAHRGAAAAESAAFLLRGERMLFLGGACAAGIAVPLLVVLVARSAGEVPLPLIVAAAVVRLGGDFALRLAFLRVGMYNPVV